MSYSNAPPPRYKEDGNFSGLRFLVIATVIVCGTQLYSMNEDIVELKSEILNLKQSASRTAKQLHDFKVKKNKPEAKAAPKKISLPPRTYATNTKQYPLGAIFPPRKEHWFSTVRYKACERLSQCWVSKR
jgi:hypothetical protein